MRSLFLTYFNAFQAKIDDKKITNFRSANTEGLLVYLTLEADQAHAREVLATMFWPDKDSSTARKNLSQSLYQLNRVVLGSPVHAGEEFLLVTNQTIQFNQASHYYFDVHAFVNAVEEEDWETAVSLYTGELLAGFPCDSVQFEDWLLHQRERYKKMALYAMEKLTEAQLISLDFIKAQETVRLQLTVDPAREKAHRQLMRALAMSGDRSGALAQFDRCFEILQHEFGVEPSAETDALYEKIVTNVLVAKTIEGELPDPPTAFIGRTAEHNHVVQTLNRSDCKLLTLVGMGGIGKTRLAIQVAQSFIAQTQQKAVFVSCLGNNTVKQVIHSIAEQIGTSFAGIDPAVEYIIEHFAHQPPILLILDNVESVLVKEEESLINFLNRLCEVDSVRLLITSRLPVRVQQAWQLPINGLTCPASHEQVNLENWQQYDALHLFVQRAQQARITFDVTRKNLADLIEICNLLAGNPLGIELAAAQVGHQAVSEILTQLNHQPDKLAVGLIDLPIRHRNLYGVFAQTWDYLSEGERLALRGTAVFQNSFTRAAARAVLGDSANYLESLVVQSLLTRQSIKTGATRIRYQLTHLLRAFIRDQYPPHQDFFARHAVYYLNQAIIKQGELGAELENTTAAWHWLRQQKEPEFPSGWDEGWLTKTDTATLQSDNQHPKPKSMFFAGRGQELSKIGTAVSAMIHNNAQGELWTITGEAGIGKSAFTQQLKDTFPNLSWFECLCNETYSRAFHPFRYWLNEYFGQTVAKDRKTKHAFFTSRLDDIIYAVADNDLAAELKQLKPFFAALIDLQIADFTSTVSQPDQQKENFIQAIKALIKAESTLRPVIIHIEDAHWLDSESRELIETVLTHAEAFPFSLILTARPEQFEPVILHHIPSRTIRLAPLHEADIRQITDYYLGAPTDANIIELLLNWCGGNPFYTQQLLLYLSENGLVKNGKLVNQFRPEDIDTLLPVDLHNLLVSRLQQLTSDLQEVVVKASTLGHEFTPSILAQMVADNSWQQGLIEGSKRGFWHSLSPDKYVFNHVLLRDAAYHSQFETQRKQMHKQAAHAILATSEDRQTLYSQIARHYEEADEAGLAVAHYLKAGDQARDNYFIQEAHNYYSRGLLLAKTEKEKLPLLLNREQVNHWLGNREQQKQDMDQLVVMTADSKDASLLADISLRRATYFLVIGEYGKAIAYAQTAVSQAVASDNKSLEARAMHRWGRALWQQGKPQSAKHILERGLLLAEATEDFVTQANCLYDLSVLAYYQNNFEYAESQIEAALLQFEKLSNKHDVIRCIELLGIINDAKGDFESALKYLRRAGDLCHAIDWVYGKVRVLRNLGNTYFELGDYVKSRNIQLESLELSRRSNDRENVFHCLDTIGLTYQYEGNLQKAREYFEEALQESENLGNTNRSFCMTHLGLCLIDFEEIEHATNYLYAAMSQRDDNQSIPFGIDTNAALAWLDLARGDQKFAIERVHKILYDIKTEGLDGIELPFQVFWQCYYILNSGGMEEDASLVLQEAYFLLDRRAQKIQDPYLRQNFLTQIPFHRKIIDAWESTYAK